MRLQIITSRERFVAVGMTTWPGLFMRVKASDMALDVFAPAKFRPSADVPPKQHHRSSTHLLKQAEHPFTGQT